MKKYLSILLVVAMLIPVVSVPISASAAEVESQSVAAQINSVDSLAGSSVNVDSNALADLRKQIHNHMLT